MWLVATIFAFNGLVFEKPTLLGLGVGIYFGFAGLMLLEGYAESRGKT